VTAGAAAEQAAASIIARTERLWNGLDMITLS
jgi:hypothetical protein